ncbi:MAG: RidA family protein [Pseudomonadales bacterium]|jgi:reactive intermediate/imine deaminase
MKRAISTEAAPAAIGTYSQAVAVGGLVFLSGQIPLDPDTMTLVGEDVAAQTEQVFRNLAAVAEAAGGGLEDVVKLTVYLTDLGNFATVNEVMARHFDPPYPARAAIGVAQLPRDAAVEIEGIMAVGAAPGTS